MAGVARQEYAATPMEMSVVSLPRPDRARPAAVFRDRVGWAPVALGVVEAHGRDAVAENIASGQSTPGEAIRDWMNSAGHRANILNARYTRIGAAAYRGPDGQVYWCQQFLW